MDEVLAGLSIHNAEEAKEAARIVYHLFFGGKIPVIVERVSLIIDKNGRSYSISCLRPQGCKIIVSDRGSVSINPGGRT